MLKENTQLASEFKAKLRADDEFAKNPRERYNFFYKRTPYYDSKHNIYPVMRVIEEWDD
jgi:hypothetical protein